MYLNIHSVHDLAAFHLDGVVNPGPLHTGQALEVLLKDGSQHGGVGQALPRNKCLSLKLRVADPKQNNSDPIYSKAKI